MSKLGLHIHAFNDRILEYCKNVGAAVDFILDPNEIYINEIKAAQPKSLLIFRLWVEHQKLDDPVKNAREFTDLLLAYMDSCNLDGASGYNQWDGDLQYHHGSDAGLEVWKRYADFEAERSRILHGEGYKSVVGGCSVGTPPEHWFSAFKPALEEGDFLHLHEYSAPTMWDHIPWHCLKYRHVYDYLKEHDLPMLGLIISECGIDGGVIGRPKEGWRKFGPQGIDNKARWYMEQWKWMDAEWMKDWYVVGGCAFDCGPTPGMGWQSFKMDPEMLNLWDPYVREQGVSYWEPQPVPDQIIQGIDVSEWGGEIKDEQWQAAYRAGYLMAIVQAWGGGPIPGGPNAYCEQQLAGARKAGLMTGIYIWIPPDDTTKTELLIQAGKDAAGSQYEHLRLVAMDIEDAELRPLHPSDPGGRLADAISHVKDKPVVIYSSRYMWGNVMGIRGFERYPLWDARYDKVPELDKNWVSYGGWTERAIKQYQGTTIVAGNISADLNTIHLGRLRLIGPPDDEKEKLLARIAELEKRMEDKDAAMMAARNTLDAGLDA